MVDFEISDWAPKLGVFVPIVNLKSSISIHLKFSLLLRERPVVLLDRLRKPAGTSSEPESDSGWSPPSDFLRRLNSNFFSWSSAAACSAARLLRIDKRLVGVDVAQVAQHLIEIAGVGAGLLQLPPQLLRIALPLAAARAGTGGRRPGRLARRSSGCRSSDRSPPSRTVRSLLPPPLALPPCWPHLRALLPLLTLLAFWPCCPC